MPSEAFVDLSYRGLPLGRRLHLRDVGPTTGYCEAPAPMPVGTELSLTAEGGVELAVRVVHVTEQVAGADAAPGMRVAVGSAGDAAKAWWKSLVSREDPVALADGGALAAIPSVVSDSGSSGIGVTVPAMAPPPPQAPLPSVRAATAPPAPAPAPPEPLAAFEPGPVPEPLAEEETTDKTTSPRQQTPPRGQPPVREREPNRTMVMSAVEIRDAIGLEGEAEEAEAAALEPPPEAPTGPPVEIDAEEPPPDFTGRYADKRRQSSRTLIMNAAELRDLTDKMGDDVPADPEAGDPEASGDAEGEGGSGGNGDAAAPGVEAKGKKGRRRKPRASR